MSPHFNRRDLIRVGGVIFFSGAMTTLETILTGCGSPGSSSTSSSSGSSNSSSSSSSCEKATNVTRGPYFIDEAADPNISGDVVDSSIPERSDIRADTKGSGGTQSGLPLTLSINVGSYSSSSCSPISGAQVDIWHCNAQGNYSDVEAATNAGGEDLRGQNFLRGYQKTDSTGKASFTTIYPGWYSGRTVHIHVKVRIFDSGGNVTTEATTQLFFDDSTSNDVYAANSAYARVASRDVMNSADSIYSSEDPALLVTLSGSASSGYTGTISIGIETGTVFGG